MDKEQNTTETQDNKYKLDILIAGIDYCINDNEENSIHYMRSTMPKIVSDNTSDENIKNNFLKHVPLMKMDDLCNILDTQFVDIVHCINELILKLSNDKGWDFKGQQIISFKHGHTKVYKHLMRTHDSHDKVVSSFYSALKDNDFRYMIYHNDDNTYAPINSYNAMLEIIKDELEQIAKFVENNNVDLSNFEISVVNTDSLKDKHISNVNEFLKQIHEHKASIDNHHINPNSFNNSVLLFMNKLGPNKIIMLMIVCAAILGAIGYKLIPIF